MKARKTIDGIPEWVVGVNTAFLALVVLFLLFWNFGALQGFLTLVGLLLLAASLYQRPPAYEIYPPWVRIVMAAGGLTLVALGGLLDLEGWRFQR